MSERSDDRGLTDRKFYKAKQEAACGMKCCTDSGKTCATCPSCSAKK